VTDEIIAEITDKCSFNKLKEANATVKDHSPMLEFHPNACEGSLKMYRKGKRFMLVYGVRYNELVIIEIYFWKMTIYVIRVRYYRDPLDLKL
jgi:hypothetical protein